MSILKRLPAPDLAEVRRCFSCGEDGVLIRNIGSRKRKVGTAVGGHDRHGYLVTNYKGKGYKVHHLVYYHLTGVWPNIIDHKNGIKDDNRLENLHEATSEHNNRNHRIRKTNKSGVTGVSFYKCSQRWSAEIFNNGKKINLGQFNDFNDAVAVRRKAELELGYYTNTGTQQRQ